MIWKTTTTIPGKYKVVGLNANKVISDSNWLQWMELIKCKLESNELNQNLSFECLTVYREIFYSS